MSNIKGRVRKGTLAIFSLAAVAALVIAVLTTTITVSAQSADPDWRLAPTGLTVSAGDEAGELDITWDANSQDTKTLSDYRVTWTPDGQAFKTADETDWSAYPTSNQLTATGLDAGATYNVRVRARYYDGKRSRWSDAVTGQTAVPANSPATGQPIITGTAQVRETLTAGTSSITDDNGLTSVAFSHQWIRSADGTDTDISGATASSYLLGADDLAHSIKVQVSFTDDDGYSETLTSDATAVVVRPPNVAATGQPTITGVTDVGGKLTAGTSAISDDNGLTNVVFSYQWVRSAGGADTDISGATGSNYVVTPADATSTIKVRVSFTDDGYGETLTSNATAAVQVQGQITEITPAYPPVGPLTSQQQADGDTTPADTSTTEVAELNTWRRVEIDTADDRDWIKVDLEDGKKYYFEIAGHLGYRTSPSAETVPQVIPALHGIRDPDGDLIADTTDLSYGYWRYVAIYYRAQETGTHYVDLGAQGGTSGTLGMRVERILPDDHPADSTTTSSVAVGGMTTGRIETTTDMDWFSVSLETGKAYRIDLQGVDASDDDLDDPRIDGIFDADSERVPHTANEDDGPWYDARVYIEPTSTSTHYIAVAGADSTTGAGGTRGDYEVSVSEVALDVPPNTTTAATVAVDGTYDGDINHKGDRDWIKASLTTGRAYLIEMFGVLRFYKTGMANPYIRKIFDKDGAAISRTSDTLYSGGPYSMAPEWDGLVYFEPSATAAYYIEVSSEDWHDQGSYRVKVTEVALDYPANDTTTAEVSVGGTKTGRLEVLGDVDWIKVTLTAGEEYVIHMRGASTDDGTLYNPRIRQIYDPDASAISGTRDDNSGTRRNAKVTFTALEDGVHYIEATWGPPRCSICNHGYKDTLGTYTVEVEDVDGNEVGQATAPLLADFDLVPASHDGSSAFSVLVAFSEEVAITPEDMRDHALLVSGATVTDAARVDGRKDLWELTFAPTGNGPVSILTPPDRACTETGAICTADGRPLTGGLGLWVPGPPPQQANSPATGAPSITGTAQVGETLTADTSGIADDNGLTNVSYGYQWTANDGTADTDIAGATDSTHTLAAADEGKTIKVRVSFTDDANNEETLTSAATAPVTARPDPGSAPGTPDQPTGTAVFAGGVDLEWDDVPGAASYDVQLFRNGQWTGLPGNGVGIAFYGAGAIISELDTGSGYWFQVRARNAHGSSDWSDYLFMTSTNEYELGKRARPANAPATGAPVITGMAQVGETLTAGTAGIADANGLDRVRFRFQWVSNDGSADTDITGATDSSYTLAASDEGRTLRVRVAFTDRGGYAESLTSDATGAVAPAVQQQQANSPATGAPTISGTAQVGETLAASTSGIADADGLTNVSYGYQWIANDGTADTDIADATDSTYTLAAADEGKTIKVKVSFTDDTDNEETLTSMATATVDAAPNSLATGAPTISGTAQVGETLTADTSGISDSDGLTNVSYSYQWIRNDGSSDTDIQDATGSSYTLVDADEGKTTKVKVSFTDDAGNDETVTSATTSTVEAAPNSPATGTPAISGTAQVGETLTANASGVADADGLTNVSYSYQWVANDGSTDTDIAGATDSTYTLVEADEGKTIKVKVNFTDDEGNAESLISAASTVLVAAPNSPATGAPGISGTAQVGETLTASTSGIADEDGLTNVTFSYQWLADDVAIQGATGYSHTLADSDAGKAIRVKASFSDDAGNPESLTSAATGAVAPRDPPPAPENLTAVQNADGSVTLTWDAPGDDSVTGYRILRRNADAGEHSLSVHVPDTGSDATSYTDTDVAAGAKYVYRVKAINEAGVGPKSRRVMITTTG